MLKVLIVEDEAGIRRSLIEAVNWQELGCKVCGEADSGLAALDRYIDVKPDIIITDIVMPGVDGITFLKYVKSKNENVKVLLITGHRDFDYAREAVNLGVSMFLMKPINYNDLIGSIKNLVMQIKLEKSTNHSKQALSIEEREHLYCERNDLLVELIKGRTFSQQYITNQMEMYNLNFQRYFLVTAGLDSVEDSNEYMFRNEELVHDLYLIIKDIIKDSDNIPINMDNRFICILIKVNNDLIMDHNEISSYISNLQKRIRNTFIHNLSFGISSMMNNVNDLSNSFNESYKALADKFYTGENSINHYKFSAGEDNLPKTSYFFCYDNEIVNGLKNCSGIELNKTINCIFNNIIYCIYKDPEIIKSVIVMILTLAIKKAFTGDVKNIDKILEKYDYFKLIENSRYLYQIKDIFTAVILDMHDYLLKKKVNNKKEIIEIILAYIEDNYYKNLSLGDMADYVYFSESYISSLIKVETGKCFIDILNVKRIEKAKILLTSTNLKNYEIAEKVGIRDAHYFSFLFKKITGKSPTEYLDNNKVAK